MPSGDEAYIIGNPGEAQATIQFPTGATPLGQPTSTNPRGCTTRWSLTYSRSFANNWFRSASYDVEPACTATTPGIASSDEITTPTRGVRVARTAQQSGTISIARPGGNVNREWDLDEQLWDAHGNRDVRGSLATDRPHVVKLYGGYIMPFGTTLAANLLRRQRYAL